MLPKHLSWSEIRTFCECRKKWEFLYVRRVVPRSTARYFSEGSCGHRSLNAYYSGHDYRDGIQEWLQEQEEQPLFDEEIEEMHDIAKKMEEIVDRYLDQHADDNWEIMHVEQPFEVPLSGLPTKFIGVWDLVIEDEEGRLWLVEHKFPKSFYATENLDIDGQIGAYQWAAYRTNLPIVGTIHNQILRQAAKVPTINLNGTVSRARIRTDWSTYLRAIREAGQNPEDYEDVREWVEEFEWVRRTTIYRPIQEIRNFTRDLERRAWDIVRKKKHIYRNTGFMCRGCRYYEPCLEELKGGDVDWILENDYMEKPDSRVLFEEEE